MGVLTKAGVGGVGRDLMKDLPYSGTPADGKSTSVRNPTKS